MTTGEKAAKFHGLLDKILEGAVADYWRQTNAVKRGGKTETVSIEALEEQGIDITTGDPTESIISRIDAERVIRALTEQFPKKRAKAQWKVFQAALAVTQNGTNPLNSREFFKAICEQCEGRYPRKAIRIYWRLVCQTLRKIAEEKYLWP